jgi:hypothetical protein
MTGRHRSVSGALFAAICAVILLGSHPAEAVQRVVLAWDPSPDASVTGYRVYRGIGPTPVFAAIDVGNTNMCELSDLLEGETYQFYVTAYDAIGIESEPSNTLVFAVPLPPLSTSVTRDAYDHVWLRLKVPGLPGKRVGLLTSTDLVNWEPLYTGAPGVAIDLHVMASTGQPQRFYRSTVVE